MLSRRGQLEGLGDLRERSRGGDEVRGPDGAPAEQAGRFSVVLRQVGGAALDADLVVLHDGQRNGDLPGRDADHHDRAALVGDGDRLVDGRLDGHAVEDDVGAAAQRLPHLPGDVGRARVDRHVGAEGLGPLALGQVRIGADYLSGAVRAEHRQREQADGAGSEDGDRTAGHVSGQPDRVHRRGQRLDERRGVVVQRVRHGVQAVRGQGEVVGHAALGVTAAEELQVLAQVLASGGAHLARPAGQVGFHDDPLARHRPGRGTRHPGRGARRLDHPDDLMARPVGQRDERVAPVRRVQVGSAHADGQRADQGLVRAGGGNVRCLDSDPARVDDDASHASQGGFLLWRSGQGQRAFS